MDIEIPTDEQLRKRTDSLLAAAEDISLQLRLQTERLAAAIEVFDKEILLPLRERENKQP
jgi:hypothetical protein